jgi:anti-sigma regulatory factor (Ser/Thr protein kinase)
MATALELRFRADPEAAGAARHALNQLDERFDPDVLDDIRLLVSELVTNSLRHAGLRHDQWVRLKVRCSRKQVRVDVIDPGPGFRRRSVMPSIYQIGGWGLYLVDQISDRWGVRRRPRTCVWFELDVPPRPVQTAKRTWRMSPSRTR